MSSESSVEIYEIVDRYLELCKNGGQVELEAFLSDYPDQAEEVIQYLPTVAKVEAVANDETQPSLELTETQLGLLLGEKQDLGRFCIERPLGVGGMSEVYLATDRKLERHVALKIPRAGNNQNLLDRFMREAMAMAKISHPNVCCIHDVGEVEGVRYIAMEYIKGSTLASVLSEGNIFRDAEAAELVAKISLALQSVHDAGVIHRDLKPSNIMIDEFGEPIVMDFGLAVCEHLDDAELTKSGAILGSPAYMAPEQIAADFTQIGPATDVYALGVLLYQLLTGRKPFVGSSFEVMKQIESSEPLPPSVYRPSIDRRLQSVCLKAMSKRVADRYQDPEQLAEALASYEDAAIERPKKNSWTSIIGTTVLAFAILLGLFYWTPLGKIWDRGNSNAAVRAKLPVRSPLLPAAPYPTRKSSGEFLNSGQPLGDSESVGVELADLDGDGDLDAFVANIDSQPNRVWLNRGDGHFEDSGQRLGQDITALVSLGDLDGDGDWDAVAANQDTESRIWLNNGNAKFQSGQGILAESCHHIALGDLEGDGDLDLIVVCLNGEVQFWTNDGNAQFQDTKRRIVGSQCHHASVGDVDGDGDMDLVIASHDETMEQLWLNDGKGRFVDSKKNFKDKMTRRIELFDFDGDGDLDALTCNYAGYITLWLNDGHGKYTRSQECGFLNTWTSCRYADLNGDGFLDCIATAGAYIPAESAVWLNDGKGKLFSKEQRFGGGFSQDIAIGDLDGDGDLDFFQTNMLQQPNRVWINQDR